MKMLLKMVCFWVVAFGGEVLAGELLSLEELKAGVKAARGSILDLSLEYYSERKFEDEGFDWRSEEIFRTRYEGGSGVL